jgi:formate-dependent nitrite reductase membrane component NrfD
MSWGAWVLMAITPLSIVWAGTYVREVFPNFKWPMAWLYSFESFAQKYRKAMAWVMMILAVILGVYTGILLSAFNARPLWNTSILGPLFLVSGFSTGLAAIVWMSKSKYERKVLTRIDLIFIFVELFFIIHMIMGLQAGSQAAIEASQLFLGGEFTVTFWIFVVLLGLLFPATLEIFELRGYHVPGWLPSFLILLGGLIFRFVILEAGQITRYLY